MWYLPFTALDYFPLLLKVLEFVPPFLDDLFLIAVFAGVIKGIGGGWSLDPEHRLVGRIS